MGRLRFSLLSKILLSTSVAITALFGITGLVVQRQAAESMSHMLREEVGASFRVYESLWTSRARTLESVSRLLASMSDVRAAFSTGDRATITDTAGEIWGRIADAEAVFLVTDPDGQVIAAPGDASEAIRGDLRFVAALRARFPEQVSGFVFIENELYQVAVTPVYVQSAVEPTLINVVVAGYRVGMQLAERLKRATGGSEFVFASADRVIASTVSAQEAKGVVQAAAKGESPERYAPLRSELKSLQGEPIADLFILRSFEGARARIGELQRNIFFIYLLALTAGLVLTSVLADRIIRPLRELDRAAGEVARQNYEQRVAVHGQDEIGRLGATFNSMLGSLASARQELIRQERISTIGQLSTSIVHDLRNPLAAIYGGAEMLVDSDLPPGQVHRLARNIYRASRNVKDLLQQLSEVSLGKSDLTEPCRLRDLVTAGYEPVRPMAEGAGIDLAIDIPEEIEVPVARARMERVFTNLLLNAVEAMKDGGVVRVTGARKQDGVYVDVIDNGPGIPIAIRETLFQPFVTEGKKNGLGLGLALSRQTVQKQGGELWLEPDPTPGAHFRMRLAV
ncbi:MAG TPA: ATP-binding protein [Bryobacteraceae bacterium]|nr:ATP-binding protein [Bryobacteraceae bacterium]